MQPLSLSAPWPPISFPSKTQFGNISNAVTTGGPSGSINTSFANLPSNNDDDGGGGDVNTNYTIDNEIHLEEVINNVR